jgi:signal transduction histidine kinase
MLDTEGRVATCTPGRSASTATRATRSWAGTSRSSAPRRTSPATIPPRSCASRSGRAATRRSRGACARTARGSGRSVVITTVRDDEGDLAGFGKLTRDPTARKEAEDALQEVAEELRAANAELARFAAYAAHDLTDPPRTISGVAEAAGAQRPPGAGIGVRPTHPRERDAPHADARRLLAYARAGKQALADRGSGMAVPPRARGRQEYGRTSGWSASFVNGQSPGRLTSGRA